MAFLDIQFPVQISYGSKGGPKFNTTVLSLASGFEKRNINWSEVRAEYEAQHGIKDMDQMTELLNFFFVCQGRGHSFRWKDFLDYQLSVQTIGTGDGANAAFQMKKRYQVGAYAYDRRITKPIDGTLTNVTVGLAPAVENTDFTVDYSTGKMTFLAGHIPANAADIVIGSCEFDVHCRFDIDYFDATHDFWETMSWPSIPIVEVKEKQA